MNVNKANALLLFSLLLMSTGTAACAQDDLLAAPATPVLTSTQTAASIPIEPARTGTFTPSPTETYQPTRTATVTTTATLTPTKTPSPSATATPVPTYIKLRGKVTIDQAVCHYGPGAPYLYKYGVYKGSNLEILRRIEYGNYIEIQAIGGDNPCWVKIDYMDLQGNLESLEPVSAADVRLPLSPYYAPPSGVSARRDGDFVTVFWHPLVLRPGDDSEQVPYIIEAWVCQDGQYVFRPTGSYQTAVKILDEPGCEQPSQAFFIAAEKHGYTRRVTVPWPPADDTQKTQTLTPNS